MSFAFRYLGSGCSMKELHYNYRLGHSTVAKIIRRVCSVIWTKLHGECIPKFTHEGWLRNAEMFLERANFPHCIGALDGKHVRIVQPDFSGSRYFNYKKFFSLVLFVVADANYRFNYIEVGSCGRESDSTIFENSKLYNLLENGRAELPDPQTLPGTADITMPFTFVGDEAFSLSDFVMRPYTGKFLSYNKRIFNYRLCRARRYVECTFGILTNKWRIFHRAMDVKIDLAIVIIKCCCVLHNFVRTRDGYKQEDTLEMNGLYNIRRNNAIRQGGRTLTHRRNALADYFVSRAGAVPWQDSFI